ncbi:MAG: hypothetical protein K9N55_07700 [Phycisphaerae bacterium]|nr:hypothetical protein [Phycisphaerae bacterium]
MFLKRLIIGLVTFALTVGAFWFYSQHQRTPDISGRLQVDPNAALSELMNDHGQGGTIGSVTVKRFEKTVIKDRDPDTGRVKLEWGFDELWHEGSSIWEVVSPFITLYESEVTCFVTANKGVFRIEEINNNVKPCDVTLTGAVHVHILPKPGSHMEEIFIDLDDIVFQKNTSQVSSSGQILVRSPSIRLGGRGIDFIYNAQEECIQYFRMVALDYLRVRTPREGGLFSFQTDESRPATTPVPLDANEAATATDAETLPQPLGPIYRCLLQDNVVIQTPKQKIHSLSHIVLTDILWPKTGFGGQDANALDPNAAGLSDPNGAVAMEAVPADANAVLPEEDVLDIIITCDQGILISPADSNWTPESEGLAEPEVAQVMDVNIPSFDEDVKDEAIFLAQDIAYNVLTRDARAQGPVEMTFYASDPNGLETQGQLIPINVTARQYGQFDPRDNSIVFTDQCECILQKQDANQVVEEYRLEAPMIRIELVDDKDAQAIAARKDLKRIEASGGGVTLGLYTRVSEANGLPDTFTPATGELLAGAEMTCESFECDPNKGHEIFTAQGPGTVALNNAKAVLGARPGKTPEPYYALLNGFETMKYYVADNLIEADTQDPNVLQFSYFPVSAGPNMVGQANHVEIYLIKTKAGQTQMGTLRATGNVSVEHGQNQFTGADLTYSHVTMDLIIRPGKDGRPCTVNGTSYPGIHYNLSTSELKTSLTNMSVLPLN